MLECAVTIGHWGIRTLYGSYFRHAGILRCLAALRTSNTQRIVRLRLWLYRCWWCTDVHGRLVFEFRERIRVVRIVHQPKRGYSPTCRNKGRRSQRTLCLRMYICHAASSVWTTCNRSPCRAHFPRWRRPSCRQERTGGSRGGRRRRSTTTPE